MCRSNRLTHINVRVLNGDDAGLYYSHKGFTSINVQVVCDAKLQITHIVCRWYGRAHDSRIFHNSTIKTILQRQLEGNVAVLVGDSGYPCLPYLITPLRQETARAERR